MKKWKARVRDFVRRNAGWISNLAVLGALSASTGCKFLFYQEKEPEGLKEFAKKGMKREK